MTFLEKGSKEKGLFSVIANIFVSFIGGGVLGLPYAFKEAGVIEGSVIMSVVGIISIYAMLLIIKCKYRLLEQRSQFVKAYKLKGATRAWSQSQSRLRKMAINAEDTENLLKYHAKPHSDEESDPITEKVKKPLHPLLVENYRVQRPSATTDVATSAATTTTATRTTTTTTPPPPPTTTFPTTSTTSVTAAAAATATSLSRRDGRNSLFTFDDDDDDDDDDSDDDNDDWNEEKMMLRRMKMMKMMEDEEEDEPGEESPVPQGVKKDAKMQDLTYGDLGYFAMGWFGRLVVDIVLLVSQIGFCCAYLIFICENLSDNIKGLSIVGCLAILLFFLCPLAFVRHLNTLSISSFLAQCSSLLAFAVVFWFDFQHIHHVVIHPKKISLAGFPFFLAISIYCYEGAGMVLSLESSVIKEKRSRFSFVFISTMILVTFLYIAFGVCGYLSFGKATNPIITLNLPKGKSLDFAMIVKSFLCLSMFFTYPVMMFPASKLLENHLINEPEKYLWKGNILRMLLVLLTGLVVITIPDFANLMALIGATCCTLLAFILPGLFHFIIFKESTTLLLQVVDVTLILIGMIGAFIGTYDAVNRLSASNSLGSSHLLNITAHHVAHGAVPK
ncbi:amino acid transporter AVT3C-like isoform X2 [Octopus sinensis]|uniref:Amino acid transporter AVT3C-like isoform X2 n=1 Tax=Octopus sinensis TaxID=2607531 RepID=A0A6P7TUR2_9MOLL|nr:amino acid transporter AVT3C-like isoform X2 [Octopus sinensis]